MAHQERVRLLERVMAALECARKPGRVGGRRERDKDAKRIRQLQR